MKIIIKMKNAPREESDERECDSGVRSCNPDEGVDWADWNSSF